MLGHQDVRTLQPRSNAPRKKFNISSRLPNVYFSLIVRNKAQSSHYLTFWRRNFFFLILAYTVYEMRIIQDPNTLELLKKKTAF